MNKIKFGLTATHLRILALSLMLLDHLWGTIVPGNNWMTYVGRIAFPIFAFQAADGYFHTHDFKGYCKRLAIFALISEIPFNLMIMGSPIFPFHQNVMLTLLLGLLACKAWDHRKWWKLALILLAGIITFPDYGVLGVASVLMFHVFRGSSSCWAPWRSRCRPSPFWPSSPFSSTTVKRAPAAERCRSAPMYSIRCIC